MANLGGQTRPADSGAARSAPGRTRRMSGQPEKYAKGRRTILWPGIWKETYFENCNCNMVCPCSPSVLTMPADNERCRVVLAFHIDSGEIEGVNVRNLTVAFLTDTPSFMDEAASQEQAEKLGAVFSG